MLPQLEQELTGYNSLPCSITSSNYQEENAINLCNRLPLCYNIQSEAINASYNKGKNYTVFYFIALVIQLWKPPEGVELNFSGQIPLR